MAAHCHSRKCRSVAHKVYKTGYPSLNLSAMEKIMLHRKLFVRMIVLVMIALMLTANSIYLPMVSRSTGGTPAPTQTATTTQSTTPPPSTEGALFLNRTHKTDSASAAVDATGGFHLAYAAYGAMADGNEAYYAPRTARPPQTGRRQCLLIESRRFN
jgi:hypothetical protein